MDTIFFMSRIQMAATLRSVNILVQDKRGKSLLQMRDGAASVSPLVWSLWGGAVEENDRGPRECAARELGEELGIEAQAHDFEIVGSRESTTQIALLVRYVRPVHWGGFMVHEGAGAGFFWREEIAQLPMSRTLRHYLENSPSLFGASSKFDAESD